MDEKRRMEQLLPFVEKANEHVADLVKIGEGMVIFATSEKRLVRNVKAGPLRRLSEMLFEEEIERIYAE